jgi:hypothetical protein
VLDNKNGINGEITIPYESGANEAIIFSEYLTTKYSDDIDDELEDIIVYVVGDINYERKKLLQKRALNLTHQDNVELIINSIIKSNEKVRTVGFPSVSKEIDYLGQKTVAQSRGFYGKVTNDSKIKNRYKINRVELTNLISQDTPKLTYL